MRKIAGVAILFLSGCAYMPVHDVTVSPEFKENPPQKINVFPPQFPAKHKRWFGNIERPDSQLEMLIINHPQSSSAIVAEVHKQLAGKFELTDLSVGNDKFSKWGINIAKKLARKKVPLNVDPVSSTAVNDPVLLIGVVDYGHIDVQAVVQLTGFNPKRFGRPKWYVICHLTAILVDPKTGHVLLSVEHKEETKCYNQQNPALLAEMTQKTVAELTKALLSASNPR